MSVVLDQESMAFPRELLTCCESALLLFCSGRMGAADGHWVREAGLTDVTCVDWDEKTLEPFAAAYPSEWEYVHEDAFEFAACAERRWDIVTVDMPSQYGASQVDALPMWTRIANRYVVATIMAPALAERLDVPTPPGWAHHSRVHRCDFQAGTYWYVLERLPLICFDDGPTDLTDRILDVLHEHPVRAAFFVNGENIAGREDTIRRIVAEGHEVGNHGWSHEPMDEMTDEQVRAEFVRTDIATLAATGTMAQRLRPPFRRLDRALDLGRPVELASSLGDYNLSVAAIVQAAAAVGPPLWLHELPQTLEALPALLEGLA